MKKLLCVLLALMLMVAFAVTAAAEEPELNAHAYEMTYYEGGYGAMPNRYQCSVRLGDGGYGEWFDISFGDPIVAQWPTEVGTHTVNFRKTTTIEGAGETEYTFDVSMDIIVLPLPETSGQCGENMFWSFDTKTDTLTISGEGDMYNIAESNEAFWNEQYGYEPGWWYLPVRHVVVEEGVERLSNYAFFQNWNTYYTIHETISLPTTLKEIPEEGFLTSTAMTSLTIPEGITSLTGWPFGSPGNSFTALTELHLPSSLKKIDPVTVILAGLDNRTAQPTLTTIYFDGTEEQWAQIELVTSPVFQSLFGDDYAYFYENWVVPGTERFKNLEVICKPASEPTPEIPYDITIDSPITMSQLYGYLIDYAGEQKIVYPDWTLNGYLDATIAGQSYTGITTDEFMMLIYDVYCDIANLEWYEVHEQMEAPWVVGEANQCYMLLRSLNWGDLRFDCEVVITETDIVSVTASPVTYYAYEGYGSVEFIATYKDGTTEALPYGIPVNYPDGMPSEPGTYKVKVLIGCTIEVELDVTVLPTPTTGQLGQDITWNYDGETETLTLSGTGVTYEEVDGQWVDLLMELAPKHIVVEEGIEGLSVGIFHYGMSVETLTLPTTLKAIPDALIGWNGLPNEVLDGYIIRTMSSIVIPEGITSLTSSAFYCCMGIREYYLPSTLEEIDLDTLCYVAVSRAAVGLEPLETVIYFAGTEAQWAEVKHVTGSRLYPTGLTDAELEELFATFTVVCAPEKEEIVVENGTATVPDSLVTVPEEGDTVIDVTDAPAQSVVIGNTTVDKLLNAETSLQVKLPDATVSFDKDALTAIGNQSETVTLVAKEVEDTLLNEAQKEALKEKEVAVILTLEAFAGETKITDFGTGKVTVSVPFTPAEGKTGQDYYVAYVADDGTVTPMDTTFADGMLTFQTNHFSNYVVLEEVVVEEDNPNTGDGIAWVVLMLMGTACLIPVTKRYI